MKLITGEIDDARYLEALNEAFGRWGGARESAWVFDRDAGAGTASRLVLEDEAGEWLAGSAISWRQASGVGTVGIMTGSWTRPAGRGLGCFASLIAASLDAVNSRDAAALLAFVTESNASRRRLEASGATLHPTSYVRTSQPAAGSTSKAFTEVQVTDALVRELYALHGRKTEGQVTFVYPDVRAFAGQFFERPLPVQVFSWADDYVLIEGGPGTDRVLLIAGKSNAASDPDFWQDIARHAGSRGRNVFGFTTTTEHRNAANRAGLEVLPGYLTVSPGRRLPEELLGPWSLHSGDRM